MSERYSKLFSLPENLYAAASPVVIAAGALLKDNQTGKVLAQLKLRNIGKKTIKAATVCVAPLDTVGQPLGEPVTYQYLDLHADRDADFGQKAPIALPDSATRSFAVSVVQVIFADNVIWNDDGPAWKPLGRPHPLDALGDSELTKQFRIEYGDGCKNLLLEQKDLWHCVCGGVNHQEETNCHKCGKALVELQAIDMEDLRKKKEERVAKERAEAEVARKEAEIARKKTIKIAAVVTPILTVVIAATIIISGMVAKNNAYNDALLLLENGKYEEAIREFSLLGDYKDSAKKVQTAQNEQKYASAISLLNAGKYDEAIEAFSELGNYKDSSERVLSTKYDWALALLKAENYNDAYVLFENLGDYKDAKSYFDRFQELICKGWFLPPNTYDCGSFVVN